MKRFYKKIIFFLIPVLLVWVGIELFYRAVDTNYTVKAETIKEHYEDTEVLILGSSHSYFGINPAFIKRKTYNFSNISQSLYFDELLLAKHIDSLNNLKAVVLTIGYFTLTQEDDGVEDKWRKYFYDQQMDLNVPVVSYCDPKKYSLALTRRLDKSIELISEYIEKGTIVTHYPNGYGIQDSSDIVPNKELVAKNIARKHENGSMDMEVNIRRLERMIDLCKRRNVMVFIIQMPAHNTYYKALNPAKWAKINNNLNHLADANPHVTHLSFSQHPGFSDEDLRDADHFTNAGAEKFSKLLSYFIETELQ